MKAAVEADDLRPLDPCEVRALTHELDRALARLGSGVAQKDAAAQARLCQARGQAHRRLGIEEIRRARQPARLFGDRGNELGMAMAGVVDRQPGEEVEVFLAVD